jgi:hypothetical protein
MECSHSFGNRFLEQHFPRIQGAILMKKILVTVVLGFAAVALAQDAAQPAAGQPAASASQAPVIKDPAEYNAYVGALNQKDPAAKISVPDAISQ